ncbi:MAG: hypothetical protein R2710_12845 [Acidimicrobiales bacterium]
MSGSPRVGLVLGAGGVPGGAYIRAALAELETIVGWSPGSATTIVGTSVGALNGARQPLPEVSSPATDDHLVSFQRMGQVLAPPASGPFTPVVARVRSMGGRVVARLAPAGSHAQDYEVADAPYHPGVVTISVRRGGGQRRPARLVDAAQPQAELYASAAVPGFVTPVVIDGDEWIDGAVWSSTNADLVRVEDHDALVVIAPMSLPARAAISWPAPTEPNSAWSSARGWRPGKPLVVVSPTGDEQKLRPDHSAFAAAALERVRTGWGEAVVAP